MSVALVFPPSCDPTAPMLALPSLTAALRKAGEEVWQLDANLEAAEWLLTEETLARAEQRLNKRLNRLDRAEKLRHVEQLAYAALWEGRGHALGARGVEEAVELLRGRKPGFREPARYAAAVDTVEHAFALVSAAYTPLQVSLTTYRTPFAMLDPEEIARDAEERNNPYHVYFSALAQRIAERAPDLVGVSMMFPGQVLPAFLLAHHLRRAMPETLLVLGGPAATQLLVAMAEHRPENLEEEALRRALGPFDCAVLFEGEQVIVELAQLAREGERPRGLIEGTQAGSLSELPPPDFDGLPLERYLAPELVLPYDATRGCYHGKCSFCHYGLCERGTAPYRERDAETVGQHLQGLQERHGNRLFYLSHDAIKPSFLQQLCGENQRRGVPWRMAGDIRPERVLTAELCQELGAGGLLGVSLGVESGSPRVLASMRKATKVEHVRAAIANLAEANIAVEVMAFTDFPGETMGEAFETLTLVDELGEQISALMCGRFGLTAGSEVAAEPARFGLRELWRVDGDFYGMGLFYAERRASKTDEESERVERELGRVSERWSLRSYPWAGSLSTAHTLIAYASRGPGALRVPHLEPHSGPTRTEPARFNPVKLGALAGAREAELWQFLTQERRAVSRAAYRELASAVPEAMPTPGRVRFGADGISWKR